MAEKCRLCGEKKELQQSHIIPNFVIRWLKKSGGTPFLREVDDADERIQDYKEKLLCEDCEQKFGKWETKFATKIFHPFIREQTSEIEYEEWLQLFIISISWRIIVCDRTNIEEFEQPHKDRIREVEEHWRQILNGSRDLDFEDHSHYICFRRGIESVKADIPYQADFYFDRSIDAMVLPVFGTYVYFKFPQMFFVSCVEPLQTNGITNAEVYQRGKLETQQQIGIGWEAFLQSRVQLALESPISEPEVEKIFNRVKDKQEEFETSESFKTFKKRYDRKRREHNPTDYIDMECPVCGFEHQVLKSLPKRPLSQEVIDSLRDSENIKFIDSVALGDENTNILTKESPKGAIIMSTRNKTRILSLYEDIGYIVEDEILYGEEDDPEEVGKGVRDQVQSLYDTVISNFWESNS